MIQRHKPVNRTRSQITLRLHEPTRLQNITRLPLIRRNLVLGLLLRRRTQKHNPRPSRPNQRQNRLRPHDDRQPKRRRLQRLGTRLTPIPKLHTRSLTIRRPTPSPPKQLQPQLDPKQLNRPLTRPRSPRQIEVSRR
ncbi:hypothetical protein ABID56_002347 [Alkalibacillus flavidus]|uniref:Uncharacterized protein n=1 Tax=Alkalibacillus flavidus TaxID=546021 RepID=A0ABV2L079_9BACI